MINCFILYKNIYVFFQLQKGIFEKMKNSMKTVLCSVFEKFLFVLKIATCVLVFQIY